MKDFSSKYITIDPAVKQAVNDRLRLDAIRDYKMMMELGRTDYSCNDLSALEREVEKFRSVNGAKFDLEIIDVNKLTILRALGLDVKRAISDKAMAQLLNDKTLGADPMKYFQAGINQVKNDRSTGSSSTSTYPEAYIAEDMLVPMTAYGYVQRVTVRGLSYLENAAFFNLHEEHHFMDPELDKSTELGGMRGEAFADVAALGEMLMKGCDPAIIDKVIAFRASDGAINLEARRQDNPDPNFTDISHMSALALEGLKQELSYLEKNGKTGIAAFKEMSEAERLKFYRLVTDDYSFSSDVGIEKLNLLIKATPQEKKEMTQFAEMDPELKKAFAFVAVTQKFKGHNTAPLPAEELEKKKTAAAEVKTWDAQKQLLDAAFAKGKITPENVIAAYTEIQNGLMAEMNKNPATAELCCQKLIKMENTLVHDLLRTDYVDENDKRGVDITLDSRFAKPGAEEKIPATKFASGQKPAEQRPTAASWNAAVKTF